MDYPSILKPTSFEPLVLSTGKTIPVSKTSPVFQKWSGEELQNTYGGKAVIDVDGEPCFSELAILRAFQKDGWSGVWVDTFSNCFRTIWEGKGVGLPPEKQLILDEIKSAAKSKNGCWDVFCWRADKVVFAEAKLLANDQVRSSQINWLEATLLCGFDESSFLLVEWSLA
ncbi:MAG: hypothetical protein ABI791_13160 [Acidobacteriota bacterium]